MTRKEAINLLEHITFKDDTNCMNEARRIAIEALEFAESIYSKIGTNDKDSIIVIMQKNGTYEINGVNVLEAVEKQNPKKPIEDHTFDFCPVCSYSVDYLRNYCKHCGQAIDWRD